MVGLNILRKKKKFPEVILGKNIYLTFHDITPLHITDMIELEEANPNFKKYLVINYKDEISARAYIEERLQLAKKGKFIDYAIHINSGKTIGGINIINKGYKELNLVYFIDKNFQRNGFASEALNLIETTAQKLGFKKIFIEIDLGNEASLQFTKKHKFNFYTLYEDSVIAYKNI